jgi:3',5'-cyclic AMP phosphodiesterase CpdA
MANGFFRAGQAHRLAAALDRTAKRGLFRVVMIHHPPVRNAVSQHKRLFGIGGFQSVIRRHGAELVLHGHSHLPSLNWIDGTDGKVPVVGVAAAGQSPGGGKPAAQYNLIDIGGGPGRWRVELTRRGLTGPTAPPVELESLVLAAGEALERVAT